MRTIAFRDDHRRLVGNWPLDADLRVERVDAEFGLRIIDARAFVCNLQTIVGVSKLICRRLEITTDDCFQSTSRSSQLTWAPFGEIA